MQIEVGEDRRDGDTINLWTYSETDITSVYETGITGSNLSSVPWGLSSVEERFATNEKATGSNPVVPSIFITIFAKMVIACTGNRPALRRRRTVVELKAQVRVLLGAPITRPSNQTSEA